MYISDRFVTLTSLIQCESLIRNPLDTIYCDNMTVSSNELRAIVVMGARKGGGEQGEEKKDKYL